MCGAVGAWSLRDGFTEVIRPLRSQKADCFYSCWENCDWINQVKVCERKSWWFQFFCILKYLIKIKLPARLRKAENTECWQPSGESFLDFFLARRVSPGGWGTLWVAASASSFTSLHPPASFFSLILSKSSAIKLSLQLWKSKRETVVTHGSRKHQTKTGDTAAVYWHNID